MRHFAAFYSNQANAANPYVVPVPDTQLTINGNFIKVPLKLSMLAAAYALDAGAGLDSAQLESPSLGSLAPFDIAPVHNAAVFPIQGGGNLRHFSPLPLKETEPLSARTDGTGTGSAVQYTGVEFADTKCTPGLYASTPVRATATIQQVVGGWVAGALTFAQEFPVGVYDVVGARCEAVGGVFFRLMFPGDIFYPGGPVCNAMGDHTDGRFRDGGLGVWGSFNTNSPPLLSIIGGTAAAQTLFLDLVKRS